MKYIDLPAGAPLAVQLVFLGHRLARLIERRLARHDYNRTQAAIIMALSRHPGLMAQDLVGPARVEPPSITRALQGLERRGLVRRQPHPTDGRASLLFLTEAGGEASAAMARLLQEISAEIERRLAPEQRETLRSAVDEMFSRVEEMRETELCDH